MVLKIPASDRSNYVIVKSSIDDKSEHCVLFDRSLNFATVLKIVLKSGPYMPLSGGECKVDVAHAQVLCYGAEGAPLRPRKSDGATLTRFIFRR